MSRLNKLVQESMRPASTRRLPLDDSLLELLWQLKRGVDEVESSRAKSVAAENEADLDRTEGFAAN